MHSRFLTWSQPSRQAVFASVTAVARQDANIFGNQPGVRRLRGRLIEQVFAGGAFDAAVQTAGMVLLANGRVHCVPHAEQR
jgi:hypothetical protein